MSRPLLALLAAAVIWGAAPPIFRWALFNVPLFSLAFLRFGIAALLLFPLVRKELRGLTRSSLPPPPLLLLAGLLGVTLNIALFFSGLKLSTALNAGLLIGASPLLSVAGGIFLLKEKPQRRILAGALLGFGGILLLLLGPLISGGINLAFWGNLLLLSAVSAWVGYEILSRKLFLAGQPVMLVVFFSFWVGALTFLPLAVNEFLQDPGWITALDIRGYTGIAFGALLSSFTAYLLWQWGLSKTQVQKAGIFLYIQPIVATVIAVPLLKETLSPVFLASAALIFTGLWLAERGPRR